MNIFVSTTYFGKKNSELNNVLNQLKTANIDGIEIGSTHKYQTKKYFQKIIKGSKPKRILLHNFFPPSKEEDFVINIASNNKLIRKKSIDLIVYYSGEGTTYKKEKVLIPYDADSNKEHTFFPISKIYENLERLQKIKQSA